MANGWAAAAQAGMSALSSYIGGSEAGKASARQLSANLFLQQQAQAWNEYMYKHRYQWQVRDLEKAGINKLYGLGTAPSPTSGLNSIGLPDYVGEKNGKMQNAVAMLGLAQDFSAKRAEIKKVEQETKTEEQNTLLMQANALAQMKQNKFIDEKNRAEIDNMLSQTMNNIKNLDVQDSQITLNKSSAKAIDAELPSKIGLNKAQAHSAYQAGENFKAQTQMQNNITASQQAVAQQSAQFLKNHPKVAKIVGAANALSGITGQVLTGAGVIGGVGAGIKAAGRPINIYKGKP